MTGAHRPRRPPSALRISRWIAADSIAPRFQCADCARIHEGQELQRSLYIASRSAGDLVAMQKGRLGRRLVRRAITRSLMRGLWGN